MEQAILVFTNVPDTAAAQMLAHRLVEQNLAACVNQMHGVQSVYKWQGAIERASEIMLFIKTTRARYEEVEKAIRDMHPYQVPEIIACPIVAGFQPYLSWIAQETKKDIDV